MLIIKALVITGAFCEEKGSLFFGASKMFANSVIVISSLRWPGAVTVCKGSKFCSVYVGDGVKFGATSYFPTEPPEVQSDPLD